MPPNTLHLLRPIRYAVNLRLAEGRQAHLPDGPGHTDEARANWRWPSECADMVMASGIPIWICVQVKQPSGADFSSISQRDTRC